MTDPRRIAYNLIFDWETKNTFPNLALKNALRNVESPRDRRFITALVYGVIERKITLDHFLKQCSDRGIAQLSPAVRSVLRMGLCQMFYMNVPASAACNTSVELIKQSGKASAAGYVNAVLRRCDRERENLLMLKKADFSVRFSIAPELVELLLDQYGKETFLKIMEGVQTVDNAVYLFHNTIKGSEENFLALMKAEGISIEKTDLPHLFRSATGFSVEHSAAYRDGWYHLLSRHSAEAALLMPEGTEKSMDLCAAPGGKTFVLAARTAGDVYAFDLHSHKVENLKRSAKRLGHKNLIITVADATIQLKEHIETADFVLCDVPCSGLGIMGKKPDIKYKTYTVNPFTETQRNILENGMSYLKPGGRLVYSTCTIDRRENEELIASFLEDNPSCRLDEAFLSGGQKTYLPAPGEDGFYIAVLKKG